MEATNIQTNQQVQRVSSAHDILHQAWRHPLDPIFAPKVVALIGATESRGSVGRTVFQNLGRGGFEGTVYPVNPKRSSVLCVKAYPSIGADLEKQVLAEARKGKMRVVGPNCLGVMVPHRGLNATFASTIAKPGSVGFISQSGALCTAILDWSLRENVGFSSFV